MSLPPDPWAPLPRPHFLVLGASGGIGGGFTRYWLSQYPSAEVWGAYRRRSQDLADLQTQYPERLHLLPFDLTEPDSIANLSAALPPRLHGAVNCVGLLQNETLQPEKNLRQLRADHLQTYFAVNSIGPVLLAQALLPHFRHPDPSVFAFLSAKVGSIGDNQLGGWYGYRASKAALNMFIKTAALEYRRSAPQATLVLLHPGTTDTELSRPFQKNVPPEKLFSAERTVSQLITVLKSLGPEDSGSFFSWDGARLPW
ncbi:MAG: SDR family NAD(P)-dependent oxidoreductase [Cyanobacteria bacterium RI_101]|nr:SDR family NAD(P)-dependent oxidoreductase [Cyanobacteria bacterium RI_101]